MDPTLIVLLSIALLLALIVAEAPIGLALAFSGGLGIALLSGFDVAARVVASAPFSSTARYALFVIPMYVLLGCLISNAGIGAGIYRVVNRWASRVRGGLPLTAVLATSVFSGISGSSAADVATFGRISVKEMTRHGYAKPYAAAVVAAAGTFAVLIPPSIVLVIYAIVADVSVAAMIIAGVVPGVFSALVLSCYVVYRGRVAPRDSDRAVGGPPPSLSADTTHVVEVSEEELRERSVAQDIQAVLWTVILFGTVVGGLYGGLFTATEAGAVGALVALLIAIFARQDKSRSVMEVIASSVKETAAITSMIFLLLVGGAIFTYLVAASSIPAGLTRSVLSLDVPPIVVVVIFLLALLVLGMFLDSLSTMILTVPLIAPVVIELGFDGIWFGILVLKAIEIGLITPPVGINAFIISGITRTPSPQVFRSLVPFVALDIVVTGVFVAWPELILWLPRSFGLIA